MFLHNAFGMLLGRSFRRQGSRHPRRRPLLNRRLELEPLEGRWLPSGLISLTPSEAAPQLVGTPITWTATTTDFGAAPVYQFSVGAPGHAFHMVRDFSPDDAFTWAPMQEGTYRIEVSVKTGFDAQDAQSAVVTDDVGSRVTGDAPVISSTANPLVALYSVPPGPAGTVHVEFALAGDNPSWQSTNELPSDPARSTNFFVAGMLPNTTYEMRDVFSDGTTSAPQRFTTGSLPSNLVFPSLTEVQPPSTGSDLDQGLIFHQLGGEPSNAPNPVATDLSGNVVWYYDVSQAGLTHTYAGQSLVPGGTVLLLGVDQYAPLPATLDVLREIDLAGNVVRETNMDAVNAELTAQGYHTIYTFTHDVERLPNGDTAVICPTERTIDVSGTPTEYVGMTIVVLDKDFQVSWVWDSFDHLDVKRGPILGEILQPGGGDQLTAATPVRPAVDWLHINAVSWSPEDANLVLSIRNQDWVIKIDYANGQGDGHILWRLGQGGDFTVNATVPNPWFSGQHDAHYINDSTLILFDDGNTRQASDPTAHSRGQVWTLDEKTMTATLVFNVDLGNYSGALGSAQRLANGNYSFDSGFQGTPPNQVGQTIEVRPDGTKAYVLQIKGIEYRTFRMQTLYAGISDQLTVTSTADSGPGSLRSAIALAQNGDTIHFDPSLAGQTITLTSGALAINKSLDIEGPGADQLTISGNNARGVFNISGSASAVTIAGLTIADGLANTTTATGPFGNVTMGGGLLNTGANVSLSGVSFADNQANGTQTGYVQTNLVSDIPGLAQLTDPNLRDPWGIADSASGPFSIADQMASVATTYSVTAAGVAAVPAQTVAVPTTTFGKGQGPTGQVFNDTRSFLVNGTPATFIYSDLNGTIDAWNSSLGSTAQIDATTVGALYSGLDIESTAAGDFLYAANPRQDRVDVFNGSFQPVSLGAGAFVDPQLPAGLAPFNVEGVGGDIYVAYAPPGPTHYAAPQGAGAIAVFDTSGNFIKQLIAGGPLASPWGITLAPSTFGQFGGDLLVGNFSFTDPAINAFDPVSGAYRGTLTDASGNTLLSNGQGIWDMTFGNGGNGGLPNTLYVASGLNAAAGVNAVPANDGIDGLFVAIDALPNVAQGGAVANVSGGTLDVAHCSFQDNQAIGAFRGTGGALVNDNGSTLVVDHSSFTGNQAITVGDSGPFAGAALGGAVLSAGASQASVSYTTFAGNQAHGGDGAEGGPGQNGGNGGNAVSGALDNDAVSMLVAPAASTMTVAYCAFAGNQAIGGAGGAGGTGANGGNGDGPGQSVSAGAINDGGSTLTVSNSTFIGNQAIGGAGGAGGDGGNGGVGGSAGAGAISASRPKPALTGGVPIPAVLHVSDCLFLDNAAIGGSGGAGGSGGNGGPGGAGQGGALKAVIATWDVADSLFIGNQAAGGAGGAAGSGGLLGGAGGAGQGGALYNGSGSVGTVADSLIMLNTATGGAGAPGGNGGNGQGGAIYNDATSGLTLRGSAIVLNKATGGVAGSGSAGQGVGGGLYLMPGADVCADLLTAIFGNRASTSDDNVFGTLGAC